MDSQIPEITQPHAYLVRNRITLLLIFAVFAAPVLVAYFFLQTGYYSARPTVNKGDLVTTPLSVELLQLQDFEVQKKWWLLYIPPSECDKACENSLFQMRQVRTALGQEMARVERLVVHVHPIQPKVDRLLQGEFKEFKQIQGDGAQVDGVLNRVLDNSVQAGTLNTPLQRNQSAVEAGRIYVIDPMGTIMLSYPAYQDEAESILKGKNILQDLTKLLKESRIG